VPRDRSRARNIQKVGVLYLNARRSQIKGKSVYAPEGAYRGTRQGRTRRPGIEDVRGRHGHWVARQSRRRDLKRGKVPGGKSHPGVSPRRNLRGRCQAVCVVADRADTEIDDPVDLPLGR